MANGDIAVFKVDIGGIAKIGFAEAPVSSNPQKTRLFSPVADIALALVGGKPLLFVIEPKGRLYAWEVLLV